MGMEAVGCRLKVWPGEASELQGRDDPTRCEDTSDRAGVYKGPLTLEGVCLVAPVSDKVESKR